MSRANEPSDSEIEAMLARCDAATEGPWCYENCGEKDNDWITGIAFRAADEHCEHPLEGMLTDDMEADADEVVFRSSKLGGDCLTHNDAAFIAHARTDLPRTLRALLEARREVERLTAREALWLKGAEDMGAAIHAGCDNEARLEAEIAAARPCWRPEPPDREGWWWHHCPMPNGGTVKVAHLIASDLPNEWCPHGGRWAGPVQPPVDPLPAEPPSKETR